MKVTNIMWDVDIDDILETFDELSSQEAANLLSIPVPKYESMGVEDKDTYIADKVDDALIGRLYHLPSEMTVPDTLTDVEDISDWITEITGFCHYGFHIDKESD